MNASLRIALVLIVCIAATSCTASYPTQPTPARLVTIFISQGVRGRVPINTTAFYSAFTVDADGVFENVSGAATFESSDSSIARLNGRTGFTGVAVGVATITVRYSGLTASAPIVVADPRIVIFPRLSITLTGPSAIGGRGQTSAGLQRSASSPNEDVTQAVTWNSENPQVATIDHNGIITGTGIGTTMITATYQGLSDWYWLSIVPR